MSYGFGSSAETVHHEDSDLQRAGFLRPRADGLQQAMELLVHPEAGIYAHLQLGLQDEGLVVSATFGGQAIQRGDRFEDLGMESGARISAVAVSVDATRRTRPLDAQCTRLPLGRSNRIRRTLSQGWQMSENVTECQSEERDGERAPQRGRRARRARGS